MGEAKYRNRSSSQPRKLEQLLENTYLSDKMRTFDTNRAETLEAFADLDECENITLFSPAIPNPVAKDTDPFEAFGKSLAEHHRRIMHTPYVPKDGLVDFHKTMLRMSGAIIVVIAEPACGSNRQERKKSAEMQSLLQQFAFIKALLDEQHQLPNELPVILVLITATTDYLGSISSLHEQSTGIDTIMRATDYKENTLRKLATEIFD